MVRVVPVLDVLGGVAVRAVGGRRHAYRPLEPECDPRAVARRLVERASAAELYVADLDAITARRPNAGLYRDLPPVARWIDAGVRDAADLGPLLDAGVEGVVAGLETLRGPDALAGVVAACGPGRVVFSLDLMDGRPLGDSSWPPDPLAVAAAAVGSGVRRLIVLDLARVGGGTGTGTEELCRRLAAEHPGVEVIAGGGVRGQDDLRRLADAGVAAALVASALHDGRLGA